MKSLKLILGLALGTTGLGSTIAFGVANNVAQQNSVAPAEAATATGENVLLIGTWDNPGEDYFKKDKTIVWYWGTNIESKAIAVNKIHNRLAYVTLPKNTTHFKITRTVSTFVTPNSSYPATEYNTTGDIVFNNSCNVLEITGWNNSYQYQNTKTLVPKGSTVFFDASALTSYKWSDAKAKPYMYAALDNEWYYVSPSNSWNLMTRIGSSEKYYYTATSDMVLDTIVFTRNNPSGDPSWSTTWTQTSDVKASSGFNPYYCVKLKNTGGHEGWESGSEVDTANAYGQYFLDTVTCDNGKTAPSSTNWGKANTMYNTLSSLVQYTLYSGTANKDSSVIYEQALARYDLIASKYSYTNFINRTLSSGSPMINPVIVTKENGLIITIIIISSLALTGFVLILAKKRKHQ